MLMYLFLKLEKLQETVKRKLKDRVHLDHPQYFLFGFPGLGPRPRQNGVTLTPPTKKRATQSLQNPLKNMNESVRERERERERERQHMQRAVSSTLLKCCVG